MYERRNKYLERRLEDRARGRRSRDMNYDADYRREPMYDDFKRDYRRDYYPEYDSRYDYAGSSRERGRISRMGREYDREYARPYDYRQDYASESDEYDKDLRKWVEKLKSTDRFKVSKEQIITQARNMGVEFNEFSEDEFYATYLMMVSDYKTISNDYNMYIKLAIEFLRDEDSALKGSDKLCAYMYEIIMAD